jgi:chromosome partitioning protein
MKVITFTNNKGGVGKTTTSTNVALGVAATLRNSGAKNSRVLLIDTDSQAHSTLLTTGRQDFTESNSLYKVLRAERNQAAEVLMGCIIQSNWDRDLYVLPASNRLEDAEREMIGISGSVYRLDNALKPIANEFAVVIIDTKPSISLITEMALVASTDAVVPIEPRYLETVGLASVVNKINQLREDWRSPQLKVSGLVVTKMDNRIAGHKEKLEMFASDPNFGSLILGVIPVNEAVSYAHENHMSIFAYDANSAAAMAYIETTKNLIKRVIKN